MPMRPCTVFPEIDPLSSLQFAASAKWRHGNERLDWLSRMGFGIAFSPNPENLFSLEKQLKFHIGRGVPIRFHAFFPGFEIGDTDRDRAALAMELHDRLIDAASRVIEEAVITCHIGLTPHAPLDPSRCVDNLGRLLEKAKPLGVTIALENLKAGPTADPDTFHTWTEESGSAITLDIGHALSSSVVQTGETGIHEIIERAAPRLVEVHYYEKETNRHHRPEDMRILGPVVDHLLMTHCRWWTIELEQPADILHTRKLTEEYMATRTCDMLLNYTGTSPINLPEYPATHWRTIA